MNVSDIPFDDEFVSLCLADLLALKINRSIITGEQVKKVVEILDLTNNSAEQLQAKRNSVVKLLTKDREDDAAWATMSGVTHVIDGLLMELYRPVSKSMKFDIFVGGEFVKTFKCSYDDNKTFDENVNAARNSFLFMFETPISNIALKNIVVE